MIELRCVGCGYPLDIFSDREARVICRLCRIKGRWPKAPEPPPGNAEGAACALGG